jgi:hypothetical protein
MDLRAARVDKRPPRPEIKRLGVGIDLAENQAAVMRPWVWESLTNPGWITTEMLRIPVCVL